MLFMRVVYLYYSVLYCTCIFVLESQILIGSLPAFRLWFTCTNGTASYSWHSFCSQLSTFVSSSQTAESLCLQCAILEQAVELGFKEKIIIIVNCGHRKVWCAPWPGSLSEIKQKITILKYKFIAITELKIWNVYLEMFCESTDALTLKINTLPGKLRLRGASTNKEGHIHDEVLFIAHNNSNKRYSTVT